jgi:hypothetical protein
MVDHLYQFFLLRSITLAQAQQNIGATDIRSNGQRVDHPLQKCLIHRSRVR